MTDAAANPLLVAGELPEFSTIRPEHVVPAIEHLLGGARARVAELLARDDGFDWDNLAAPMEHLDDELNRAWSPVAHLHAVADNEALRAAYNACLPMLSEYASEIGQNRDLFRAYRSIADEPGFADLEPARQRVVTNALRDFRLAGVDLDEAPRARFREIAIELSTLASRFEENVLDATQAWSKHLTEERLLAGLPCAARDEARERAQARGLSGWVFNLEFPSYFAVMSYAEDRALRRETYEAYATRASERGPTGGRFDNGPVMERMLALRQEQAGLLGYANFAEFSLATKMAPDSAKVMEFLHDLATRSRALAESELSELDAFARSECGLDKSEAWDMAFCSERLRRHTFDFSQEDLRPYFPLPGVLEGMFDIVGRLYGLEIVAGDGVDTWHPDVQFFEIRGAGGEVRGRFYLDAYARPGKRGGAWMDECRVRRREGDSLQTPVAYLTCNFAPPAAGRPALLTHDDVITLFHEFGHGLHHMLTLVDYPSISGINGVAWDAVELPSQFMENWCWEREALLAFAAHYETGEPLPEVLYEKLRAAKNFQSGLQMLRQLEFSIFDFRLHMASGGATAAGVQDLLDEVRAQYAVVFPPEFNRFAHAFSHIFGGGYAAGYYSYKWAEVLSSDAFSLFEERGLFDRPTGLRFLHSVLEQGGSRDAMDLFIDFRGREPRVDALLRHSGIPSNAAAAGQ